MYPQGTFNACLIIMPGWVHFSVAPGALTQWAWKSFVILILTLSCTRLTPCFSGSPFYLSFQNSNPELRLLANKFSELHLHHFFLSFYPSHCNEPYCISVEEWLSQEPWILFFFFNLFLNIAGFLFFFLSCCVQAFSSFLKRAVL